VCGLNVYFANVRRHGNGKTTKWSISATPLRFDDAPARNAFEYLEMIYIAKNWSH